MPSQSAPQPLPEAILHDTSGDLPEGLARFGRILRACADDLLREFASRVRADPLIPPAATLPGSEIEDHGVSFIVDVAQSLISLEGTDGEIADFLRDGTEIQRLIARLHGAQRARLGWTEKGIRREFDILRELVGETLRREGAARGIDDEIDRVVDIVGRFIDPAERISLRSWRRSVTAEVG